MLRVFRSLQEMNFERLMCVYEEGNRVNGRIFYPNDESNVQLLLAEQDFLTYLKNDFFQNLEARYAVWEQDSAYVSALRLEPYKDGLLLAALETAPLRRKEGFAGKLMHSVLEELAAHGSVTVYSHVGKKNEASLKVHLSCGFEIISDHAVYIDGSVDHRCYTLKFAFPETNWLG